jgi:hypothetical protein
MSDRRPSPYLVGPIYDWVFFLLSPLLSLLIGIAISGTAFTDHVFTLASRSTTGVKLLMGTIVHAHLVAVFFRSHGNPTIRGLHPVRFFLIPVLLFILIRASDWIGVTSTIVVMFWDVWHSGAQTFGFGRIYDRNAGNPPELGRRLDYWLNHLLYAGPILGGVTLVDHLIMLEGYHDLGTTLFCAIPARAPGWQRYLAWIVLGLGTVYLAYYLYAYVRMHRQGYRVSFLKVFLTITTGACSIYSWGFNSWGEAFFIMNLFHAIQYLALVWATEQRQMARLLGKVGRYKALVGVTYLGAVLAYGLGAELTELDLRTLWTVTIVVSILHFWYDGFIWSVAKRQI